MDVIVRGVPRQHWIRVIVTFRRSFWTGHCWTTRGLVRRDVWRIGPVRFGVLRLPKNAADHWQERDQGAGT